MLIELISPEKKHPPFSHQILEWEAIYAVWGYLVCSVQSL